MSTKTTTCVDVQLDTTAVDVQDQHSLVASNAHSVCSTPNQEVTAQKREYSIVGDAYYPSAYSGPTPTWLSDIIDSRVDTAVQTGLTDYDLLVQDVRNAIDSIDVAKNTFVEEISFQHRVDGVVGSHLDTLNATYNDKFATIANLDIVEANAEYARVTQANDLKAAYEGYTNSRITSVQQAYADADSAIADDITAMDVRIDDQESGLSATADAVTGLQVYVGIDESTSNPNGTGLLSRVNILERQNDGVVEYISGTHDVMIGIEDPNNNTDNDQLDVTKEPYASWISEDTANGNDLIRAAHIGDVFLQYAEDGSNSYVRSYKFIKAAVDSTSPYSTDPKGYTWAMVTDSDAQAAYALALEAKDLADGKRRVFLVEPFPPYDAGDLWVRSDVTPQTVMVADQGASLVFSLSHWRVADQQLQDFVENTYTGDSAQIHRQLDGKVEYYFYESYTDIPGAVDESQALASISAAWTTQEAKDDANGNVAYFKDSTNGYWYQANTPAWVAIIDTSMYQALKKAAEARGAADGKVSQFYAWGGVNAPADYTIDVVGGGTETVSADTFLYWFKANKLYHNAGTLAVPNWVLVPTTIGTGVYISEGDLVTVFDPVDGDTSSYSFNGTSWQSTGPSGIISKSKWFVDLDNAVYSPDGHLATSVSGVKVSGEAYTDAETRKVENKFSYDSIIYVDDEFYRTGFGMNTTGTAPNGSGTVEDPYDSEFWVNAERFVLRSPSHPEIQATFKVEPTGITLGLEHTEATKNTPKGSYSATTTYRLGDMVTYNGSSYTALRTVTGVAPIDDDLNWQLMAAKGDEGVATGVKVIYAYDASGTNASFTQGNRTFMHYYEWSGSAPVIPPTGLTYVNTKGEGAGVIPIYANNSSGSGASFTYTSQEWVNFYEWVGQAPSSIPSGLTYVRFKGIDGADGRDGANGVSGEDGVSIIWKGAHSSHPSSPQDGWAYKNTSDGISYVRQSGAWYEMAIDGQRGADGLDGVNGADGNDGLDIVWKGDSTNPPSNPVKNWVYRDLDNGLVYIFNGSAWELMVSDGSDGADGANGQNGSDGSDGLSVYITYHFNSVSSQPSTPSGNGTTGGWTTTPSSNANWMSQKVASSASSGTWGSPILITGRDGINGTNGLDGVNGTNGKDGLDIVWKGESANPPSNPVKNWTYRDTDNGLVYIYNGSSWVLMVADGNDGINGANGSNGTDGSDGFSVYITYHNNAIGSTPTTPTGNGTSGGWTTVPSSAANWLSQKVASSSSAGSWGAPILIAGRDGIDGKDGYSNLLRAADHWVVGSTGSQGPFSQNGATSENSIVLASGPLGVSEPLWEADGVGNDADGGWNAAINGIDHTKTYRSCVWMKQGHTDMSMYLGCSGSSTANLSGTTNSNPYFWSGDLPTMNKWYLVVGVIHGSGYTGSDTGISGVYDPISGNKVIDATEYKNRPNVTSQIHRAYRYYGSNSAKCYFARPRFEEVNGEEYSIQEILGRKAVDGVNGADGINGSDGVSMIFKGNYSSHPGGAQNGWTYYNTTTKRSYVYQDGTWYQMTVDGVDGANGANGNDGLSIVHKGDSATPPSNPVKNWTYRDTDNGRVYLYNGSSWVLMVADGSDGADGTNGSNGLSVFITYHSNAVTSTPSKPTGNGASGGWTTTPSTSSNWMSQKVASSSSSGTWGNAIRITGQDGADGQDGKDGSNGANGARGVALLTHTITATTDTATSDTILDNLGTYWNTAASATYDDEIAGDTLIVTNPHDTAGWTHIYEYSGSSWSANSVFTVNGDQIVNGTIKADALVTSILKGNFLDITSTEGDVEFTLNPRAAIPIKLEDASKVLFSIDKSGDVVFGGTLSPNTVTEASLTEEARKAINPYYLGATSASSKEISTGAMATNTTKSITSLDNQGGEVYVSWDLGSSFRIDGETNVGGTPKWDVQVYAGSTLLKTYSYTGSASAWSEDPGDLGRPLGPGDYGVSGSIACSGAHIYTGTATTFKIKVVSKATSRITTLSGTFKANAPAFRQLRTSPEVTSLYNSPTGLGSGTITLTQAWKDFDFLTIVASNDSKNRYLIHTIPVETLKYTRTRGGPSDSRVNLIADHSTYWFADISSETDISWSADSENAVIYNIFGIKMMETTD